MSSKSDLSQSFQTLVRLSLQGEEYYSKVGIVVSVDVATKSCEVSFEDGTPNTETLLQQSETDTGFLLVPVVGKPVVISYKSINNSFVSLFSDIEEIVFQAGSNEGIVKVVELTEKLNALENGYNDLVSKFNTHIHITTATVGSGPTPGVLMATASAEPTVLTPTIKTEIQNEKFTH